MGEYLKINQEYAKVFSEKLTLNDEPVGIKFINSVDEAPEGVEIIKEKIRHCEMIKKASMGEKFYSTSNEQMCKGGSGAIGLEDMPPKVASGEKYFELGRFKDLETAKKTIDALSIIPERHFGIIYAPLKDADFEVDVVVILAKPIVAMKIGQALVYSDGDKVRPNFAGIQSLCGDVVAYPYIEGGSNITVGCDGSRSAAKVKDEELAIGISKEKLEEVVENLKII